jgi:4-hydroxythreonine-4-phosphate dehydrogenase
VIDVPRRNVVPGVLDKENGRAVLATLDAAVEGVRPAGSAPWSRRRCKKHDQRRRRAFSGHTEYLAEKTGTPQVVMMLAGEPGHGEPTLRVALATTHLPLKDVSAALTRTAWPHARHHQPICNGNSASPRRASW